MQKNHHEASISAAVFLAAVSKSSRQGDRGRFDQFMRERGMHHGIGGAIAYISGMRRR